ncbi:MAG: hypothetical protein ACPGKS_08740 [Coraliomargarita sp.]
MKTLSALIACSILSGAAGYVVGVKQSIRVKPESPQARVAPSSMPQEAPQNLTAIADASTLSIEIETTQPEPAPLDLASTHATRADRAMQTLTDTKGRSIQAKVLKVSGDQVTIRRADGLETTIPLSMLSSEDVEFCEYLREQSTPEPSDEEFDWDAIFG